MGAGGKRPGESKPGAAGGSPGLQPMIWVLHGPNLNLLGMREPAVYGRMTLQEIDDRLAEQANSAGAGIESFQSNHEGALIDRVHAAKSARVAFIIINPGGLTHTSVALRDALVGVAIPFLEVHLSNVYAREPFRHHSYLSEVAVGCITGLGAQGYELALTYALERVKEH